MLKRYHTFDIPIAVTTLDKASHIIRDLAHRGNAAYVCIVNVHVLVSAKQNRQFRNVLVNADCSFPDGVPLVWYAKHSLGIPEVGRVAGPSLMPRCFDELSDLTHFFLWRYRRNNEETCFVRQKEVSGFEYRRPYLTPIPASHVF